MAAQLPEKNWHIAGIDEVLRAHQSHLEQGLTSQEAAQRLAKEGPNELKETGGRTLGHIIWEQVSSVMILILVVAGFLALFFKGGSGGPPIDAIAIFAIVVLFVVLGVLQEYRAHKAIAALKQMSAPTVRVVRDGRVSEISGRELVRGDIVRLETGSVVPADCRIVESVNLKVQEAALTGESEAIEKTVDTFSNPDLPLGDRKNMGYMGTFASYGRGTAVVVATGMQTELGKIATMLQSVKHEQTPLQRKLDGLGKTLAIIAVVVAAIVALIGMVFEGKPLAEVLILGISIAVAIVPEGLPAVLTFTLAIGAQRMLKRKALIRKLPAVETLGSVTVICSDKTGTLTQNKMTVTRLQTINESFELSGTGRIEGASDHLAVMCAANSLCSDATVDDKGVGVGDPTEIALVVGSGRFGYAKNDLERMLPRVAELPFDSDRKLMTTVHDVREPSGLADQLRCLVSVAQNEPFVAITKGAADNLLAISTHILDRGEIRPFTDEDRRTIAARNSEMASNGIRVLGLGMRGLAEPPAEQNPELVEQGLVFVGLTGMIDPPRPEAKDAVARCKTAGIRTIMITGDHPDTARYIAADLGMAAPDARVVTGVELEKMSVDELKAIVDDVNVFARVSPEHKLKIVDALQSKGNIVAMTGDGVNDAPALKKADIGVAMGITGTDVAKEAADMVLVDDNFATIVNAVEEGRVVFDNLRRFIMFSVSGNISKVLIVAIPPLIGLVAMLKPIQILFSNLLTDGLVGLGMGMEPAEKNTMNRPPYNPSESVFSRGVGRHIAVIGPVVGFMLVGLGYWQWQAMGIPTLEGDQATAAKLVWGTLMFTCLAFMQYGRALSSRSFVEPVWRISFFGNRVLLSMIAVALVLQLIVVYVSGVHDFFSTVALAGSQLGIAIGFALLVLVVMEIEKRLSAKAVHGI